MPHMLDQCSFAVSFEISKCESRTFVFLFQDGLAVLDPLHFSTNLKDQLASFRSEASGDVDRHHAESVDRFGTFAILTILSLPIHERFKLSLSNGLWLVYRKTIDFCVLILYYAILLNTVYVFIPPIFYDIHILSVHKNRVSETSGKKIKRKKNSGRRSSSSTAPL